MLLERTQKHVHTLQQICYGGAGGTKWWHGKACEILSIFTKTLGNTDVAEIGSSRKNAIAVIRGS